MHIGANRLRYPILLSQKGCYTFRYTVKPPFARCQLVFGLDSDAGVALRLNGCLIEGVEKMTVHEGYEYVPASRVEDLHSIHAITQAAPHVYAADLPISSGERVECTVEIENKSDLLMHLLWIEFDLS